MGEGPDYASALPLSIELSEGERSGGEKSVHVAEKMSG